MKLEQEIQKATQQDIKALQDEMALATQTFQIIDHNMKGSHMALLEEITRLQLRVNFVINYICEKLSTPEEMDAKFKEFAGKEKSRLEEQISKEKIDE